MTRRFVPTLTLTMGAFQVSSFEWTPKVPLYFAEDGSLIGEAELVGDKYVYFLPPEIEKLAQEFKLYARPSFEIESAGFGTETNKHRLVSLHLTNT